MSHIIVVYLENDLLNPKEDPYMSSYYHKIFNYSDPSLIMDLDNLRSNKNRRYRINNLIVCPLNLTACGKKDKGKLNRARYNLICNRSLDGRNSQGEINIVEVTCFELPACLAQNGSIMKR